MILISCLWTSSCVFNPTLGAKSCAKDDDCREGCKCLDNRWCVPEKPGITCELECDRDEHCERGDWCREGSCVPCQADEHCGRYCADCTVRPYNRRCVEDLCGCLDDGDCAEGMKCREGACLHCFPDCTGKCAGADDGCGGRCVDPCPQGSWCDSSACVACKTDDHCGPECLDCTGQANNMACVSGLCGCRLDEHCARGESCLRDKCTGCDPICLGKCGGADDGCGGSCLADCPPGQYCTPEGSCAPCNDDSHCGLACLDCTDQRVNGAHCREDADDRLVCACDEDAECLTGFWCRGASSGVIGLCWECNTDLHCGDGCIDCQESPHGFACIEGKCGCFANSDCPGTRICHGGLCVELDGGVIEDGDDQDGDADSDEDAGSDIDDDLDGSTIEDDADGGTNEEVAGDGDVTGDGGDAGGDGEDGDDGDD